MRLRIFVSNKTIKNIGFAMYTYKIARINKAMCNKNAPFHTAYKAFSRYITVF